MNSIDPINSAAPTRPHPGDFNGGRGARQPPGSARLAGAMLWCVVVLMAGGAVASYCVVRFGERGLFVLWPIGWGAGFVAAKILGGKSRVVGGLLVSACFLIAMVAEVSWIQANIKDAEDSWIKAVTLLPAFARQFQLAAFMAVCLSIFGAMSAWRQVTVRYGRVRIDQ